MTGLALTAMRCHDVAVSELLETAWQDKPVAGHNFNLLQIDEAAAGLASRVKRRGVRARATASERQAQATAGRAGGSAARVCSRAPARRGHSFSSGCNYSGRRRGLGRLRPSAPPQSLRIAPSKSTARKRKMTRPNLGCVGPEQRVLHRMSDDRYRG